MDKQLATYRFVIPGHPRPKVAPLSAFAPSVKKFPFTVESRQHAQSLIRVYSPPEYQQYLKLVKSIAKRYIPQPMHCCRMSILYYMRVNKGNGLPAGDKQDISNTYGAISDGLEGVAFRKDWSIFTLGESDYKLIRYDEEERVEVMLEERKVEDYYTFTPEAGLFD